MNPTIASSPSEKSLVTQLRDSSEKEYHRDIVVFDSYRLPAKLNEYCDAERWGADVRTKYHSIFLKYPQKKFYVIVETVCGYVFPISYYAEKYFRHDVRKLSFIDARIGLHRNPFRRCGDGCGSALKSRALQSYVFNAGRGSDTKYVNMYKNVEIFCKESVDMLEILEMMTGGVTSA
jgi:hypothetical protein